MNLLKINVQNNIADIVDAYTKVFGNEYRDIIEQRVNNIWFVFYNNMEGIKSYVNFIESCKKRELAIKFLEQIGIDVSKQKESGYSEPFDEEISNLLEKYLGILGMEPSTRDVPMGIKAWRTDEYNFDESKIQMLNFLRGNEEPLITTETITDFCKTDEYRELADKIKGYLVIYDQIMDELQDYLDEISPYRKYLNNESERKANLEGKKLTILSKKISSILPEELITFLDEQNSNSEEFTRKIFEDGLGVKSYIEYFSQEDEKKLKSLSTRKNDKARIYLYRIKYLMEMGVNVDKYAKKTNYKELYEYCIKQKHIKNLIPSQELVEQVRMFREESYEELNKDFIYESEDFIENAERMGNSDDIKAVLYKHIKENKVCVADGSVDRKYVPFLFYAVRHTEYGILDYTLLHEICHVIEADRNLDKCHRSGFEFIYDDKKIMNEHNPQKRKYERFNETITDLFAIEARTKLQEQGIYIFDPKECVIDDVSDYNTPDIVKMMVKPFLDTYRDTIIKARITGDMNALYDRVGKENFEEFNDIISKVDTLVLQFIENDKSINQAIMESFLPATKLLTVLKKMKKYRLQKNCTRKTEKMSHKKGILNELNSSKDER